MSAPVPETLVTRSAQEAARIRAEYERRALDIPADYYSPARPAILFAQQQRARATLRALTAKGMMPLKDRRILDVGCGRGDWLNDCESWGATRSLLAGIDLDARRVASATDRLCEQRDHTGRVVRAGADLRVGDASHLPWPTASFDIVVLSTVFSSILCDQMKESIAAETARVLKPEGIVLWYDFFVDNPANRAVRGVRAAEITRRFPGFVAQLRRITLAPPIARLLVRFTWIGALVLERTTLLNTHYFGVLERRKPQGHRCEARDS